MIWYIYQTILCYFCCYVYFILLSYINPCTIHSFDIVIQHHALYCIVLLYTHIIYIYISYLYNIYIHSPIGATTTMNVIGPRLWLHNQRFEYISLIVYICDVIADIMCTVYVYSSLYLWFISFWRTLENTTKNPLKVFSQ